MKKSLEQDLQEGKLSLFGKAAGKSEEELSVADKVWRAQERRSAGQDIRTGERLPGAASAEPPPAPKGPKGPNIFDKMGAGTRQSPVKPVGATAATLGTLGYGAATYFKNDPIAPLPAEDKWGKSGQTTISQAPKGTDTISKVVNTSSWPIDPNKSEEENLQPPKSQQNTGNNDMDTQSKKAKKVDETIEYLSLKSSANMFAEAKKLKGDQYKLDKNKNGKLDSQDFKMLRGEKVEEEVVDEAKKADKDYDGDGKIESPKDEVWGSRFKAAKKAGKMEEAAEPALKKSTTSDPDFAAPSANPDAPESPIKFAPKPTSNTVPSNPPLPPKRPDSLKETYLNILRGK